MKRTPSKVKISPRRAIEQGERVKVGDRWGSIADQAAAKTGRPTKRDNGDEPTDTQPEPTFLVMFDGEDEATEVSARQIARIPTTTRDVPEPDPTPERDNTPVTPSIKEKR